MKRSELCPFFQYFDVEKMEICRDPSSSLPELEQLRVLAMYEFDPPLSNNELIGALDACDQHTEAAYQYLKVTRRCLPKKSPVREGEKRRFSASSLVSHDVIRKRPKDASFDKKDERQRVEMSQNEEKEASKALKALRDVVADQVSGRQPLRHPMWMEELAHVLHISSMNEVSEHLKLTIDTLCRWRKELTSPSDQEIETRGSTLIVDIIRSLSSDVTDVDDSIMSRKDEVLTEKDTEVAAIKKLEETTSGQSAYDRAYAAKQTIECVSAACKAYMDELQQWTRRTEATKEETSDVKRALEALRDRIVGYCNEIKEEVEKAECAFAEAKDRKEKYSQQIVEFVHKRYGELIDAGETEASASLQSVVDVWNQKYVEVQKLWSLRNESEKVVETCEQSLKTARLALAFHNQLLVLCSTVRACREANLLKASRSLKETQERMEMRAAAALEHMIPMLTRALCRYFEFHSIQQAKAKKELLEQENALAVHNEYFGDSAPLKKSDIERRIREFTGVTQCSMQQLTEMAETQEQLWEKKRSILPEAVRSVLYGQFQALWLQLSGPMQDVMKKVVTTMEETAGGLVAVDSQDSKLLNANEQLNPAFREPVFLTSHMEAMSPYRTAVSAIVALEDAPDSRAIEKKGDDVNLIETTKAARTETNALSIPEARQGFAIGSILYSKILDDDKCAQFVRGVVVKQLENDMYEIEYYTGERFTVHASSLCTKETVRWPCVGG
ncbi:hypothetical protein PsorP6_008191 [Peronosclerospora sorghi]|uniref:Uncharacterized protein n=1 Tax=Peronosclerospora sorghi TaxID=230839 RepID=A0ACC0WBF3_9STRA|nr:hypothetical protein PsorP6_008191 [Peronosclerospora sorghi]